MHGIQTKGKAKEENKGLVKKEETKMIKNGKSYIYSLVFPDFFISNDWLVVSVDGSSSPESLL